MEEDRAVCALGYLRLGVDDVEAWRPWARDVYGMAIAQGPRSGLRMRVDERAWRMEVLPKEDREVIGVGWETANAQALAQAAGVLERLGIAWEQASEEACRERGVSALILAQDPAGISMELFWGAQMAKEPFASPLGTRFVAGPLGLGHVVFRIPRERFAAELTLYESLGFRLTDQFRIGNDAVHFMRCNPRHHSFAVVPADVAQPSLVHCMVEASDIDAVGLALDKALSGGAKVKRQLGRHTNDNMMSFYAETPSGFDIEFGWGGRLVDESTWTVTEVAGGTRWGHRPPQA